MHPYLRFWAKTRDRTGSDYHPVAFHGLDVAAAGRRLLETNGGLRRRLARISGLAEEPLLDWVSFVLAIHDIGKLADSFQNLRPDLMLLLQQRTSALPYVERHDALGLGLWREVLFPSLVARRAMGFATGSQAGWRDLLKPWLSAGFGHHGKPVSYRKKELTAKLFPASVQLAAVGLVEALAELLLSTGLPFQATLGEEQDHKEDRFIASSWLFAGTAVAADWIGSNSDWFPFHGEALEPKDYWRHVALPCAERALRASGLVTAAPGGSPGVRALVPRERGDDPPSSLSQGLAAGRSPRARG